MTEREIQNSILSWLQYHRNILAFQINTTALYDPKQGIYRTKSKYVLRGTPDILACLDVDGLGVFIGLEVKTPQGKCSAHQRIFEERLKRVAGYYFVVRSIPDVQKALLLVEQDVKGRR